MKSKKKGSRRRRNRSPSRSSREGAGWWVVVGLAAILILTLASGGVLNRILLRPATVHRKVFPRPIPQTVKLTPTFEVYPAEPEPPESEVSIPAPSPLEPTPAPLKPAPHKPAPAKEESHRPKIAIVIDDIGYDRNIAKKFIELGVPISLAILPHSPFQNEIAKQAKESGIDTLLHLPMEPIEYPRISPGPGALMGDMSPQELSTELIQNLNSIDGIRGVNNHMGSYLTTLPKQLEIVFTELKRRHLFFLDSRTTAESCAEPVAKQLGLPFAGRNIFLDNTPTSEDTRKQLIKLLSVALRKGKAIGIGHPHETTYEELAKALSTLKDQVTLVPVSQLVEPPG
jgi:uncharacterized protein